MTLTGKQWGLMIAGLGALGFARVSQQTAIHLEAYALGRQLARAHELENETERLRAQVIGLESPARLAKVLNAPRTTLAARVILPQTPRGPQLAKAGD